MVKIPIENPYSELDDLDYGIVAFLQENARIPFTQIASELGVTERTVRLRVAQMQEEGILSLVGIVNPIKAGINVQSVVQVQVTAGMLDNVASQLKEIDEVRLVVLTSGEYQLMLQVFTRNHEELSTFMMHKLNLIEGISKTNVILELKVLKSRFKFIR